jgi:hypothetical protein
MQNFNKLSIREAWRLAKEWRERYDQVWNMIVGLTEGTGITVTKTDQFFHRVRASISQVVQFIKLWTAYEHKLLMLRGYWFFLQLKLGLKKPSIKPVTIPPEVQNLLNQLAQRAPDGVKVELTDTESTALDKLLK